MIGGFLLGFLPFVALYRLPIQIISTLILSFGLYLEGGIANEASWKMKVKELEAKIAVAEAKSEKVTTEVVTQVITKKQIIKEKGATITEYIDREVVKYDSVCPIPEAVVRAHNAAALNDTTLLISTDTHNVLATPKMKLATKK